MAFALRLNGPWTRMPESFDPIKLADMFTENEVASRLNEGRYLMIYDLFGDQEIGYSLSTDGINWSHGNPGKSPIHKKHLGGALARP